MAYVIGVDVGGTFTDAVLADEAGNVLGAKSPSTPPDYSMGVLDVLGLLAEQMDMPVELLLAQTHHIAHGTTSSLNALVMGNVPPVGFITTRGHRDSIYIMNVEGWVSDPFRIYDGPSEVHRHALARRIVSRNAQQRR